MDNVWERKERQRGKKMESVLTGRESSSRQRGKWGTRQRQLLVHWFSIFFLSLSKVMMLSSSHFGRRGQREKKGRGEKKKDLENAWPLQKFRRNLLFFPLDFTGFSSLPFSRNRLAFWFLFFFPLPVIVKCYAIQNPSRVDGRETETVRVTRRCSVKTGERKRERDRAKNHQKQIFFFLK